MKTKVTVSFTLESLRPLSGDLIDAQIQEKLIPEDSNNWLETSEVQALFDLNSLEVSVNKID